MSLAQRITDQQERLNGLRDQLEAHIATYDDSNITDEQLATTSDLNGRIAQAQRGLEALEESEANLARTAARGANIGGGAQQTEEAWQSPTPRSSTNGCLCHDKVKYFGG